MKKRKKIKITLLSILIIIIAAGSYLLYQFKFKEYETADEEVSEIIEDPYVVELPDGTSITIDEEGNVVQAHQEQQEHLQTKQMEPIRQQLTLQIQTRAHRKEQQIHHQQQLTQMKTQVHQAMAQQQRTQMKRQAHQEMTQHQQIRMKRQAHQVMVQQQHIIKQHWKNNYGNNTRNINCNSCFYKRQIHTSFPRARITSRWEDQRFNRTCKK